MATPARTPPSRQSHETNDSGASVLDRLLGSTPRSIAEPTGRYVPGQGGRTIPANGNASLDGACTMNIPEHLISSGSTLRCLYRLNGEIFQGRRRPQLLWVTDAALRSHGTHAVLQIRFSARCAGGEAWEATLQVERDAEHETLSLQFPA